MLLPKYANERVVPISVAVYLVAFTLLMGSRTIWAQTPVVRLTTEMNPAGPLRLASTGLLVTVESDRALANGALAIQAPNELRLVLRGPALPAAHPAGNATPSPALRIPLGEAAGIQSFLVDVHWSGEPRRKIQVKLIAQAIADVAQDTGTGTASGRIMQRGRILTQTAVPIDVVRTLGLAPYFWLGLIGVFVGWLLRIVLFAQSRVPVPNPAPVADTADTGGKITRFVEKHYYAVDMGLALTLGALALLALATDGNPPERTDSKVTAFVFGVALGALTNSELLLKFRR
jgi:hypothetical protein